jgi:hypothetical protein
MPAREVRRSPFIESMHRFAANIVTKVRDVLPAT